MDDVATTDPVPDLSGRVALVTGANSGLGYEIALALLRAGARVELGCRDRGRGEAAAERLLASVPVGDVHLGILDLADLASVREFASSFEGPLDLLVNNAGVMAVPKGRTADGFETQFGTNHLGHFALTGLLLPA
ncbi:MAG: hypothetical protein QOI71_1391, partial [Gaiellales bacterium]|nr:hypothetical protein [Gaiellales bacterium]